MLFVSVGNWVVNLWGGLHGVNFDTRLPDKWSASSNLETREHVNSKMAWSSPKPLITQQDHVRIVFFFFEETVK